MNDKFSFLKTRVIFYACFRSENLDWLFVWSVGLLKFGLLFVWSVGWLGGCFFGRSVVSVACLIGSLVVCVVGWLVICLFGRLTGRSVGWLVSRSVGRQVQPLGL